VATIARTIAATLPVSIFSDADNAKRIYIADVDPRSIIRLAPSYKFLGVIGIEPGTLLEQKKNGPIIVPQELRGKRQRGHKRNPAPNIGKSKTENDEYIRARSNEVTQGKDTHAALRCRRAPAL